MSLPGANSEVGKTRVHFKVNSGIAQCKTYKTYWKKSRYESFTRIHQDMWESTAITLWAKLLSGEIPFKASHRRLLWPSMVSSSFLLFLSILLSCIFFLACCLAFLLALSLSLIPALSLFLYFFLYSFLPSFLP